MNVVLWFIFIKQVIQMHGTRMSYILENLAVAFMLVVYMRAYVINI